ncbi:uncharacterized protein BJ171DRAFT_485779 [Polychytrium aggregatum]|uniref:uncharacterized protein n=1 Tax=Polychytrium aggregatum TaxID=110093 RepID=UPI0022FDDFFF|nr:uncharacterized protein BJ171DRAFT_485779 [Polychytrium aggregatum]KAI9209221.1 hypothetical protein BJ171DRAFT_485779 [Polychytrium aggregatum]
MDNLSNLGLDFMFWASCKLNIRDIHRMAVMEEYQDVFRYKGRPVRNAEICGLIVGIDESHSRIGYLVDDGTGTINCWQWLSEPPSIGAEADQHRIMSLGDCVVVSGKIKEYRDVRQLTVNSIRVESDPNFEALAWMQTIDAKLRAYDRPIVLSESSQRELALRKTQSHNESFAVRGPQSPDDLVAYVQGIAHATESHVKYAVEAYMLHETEGVEFQRLLALEAIVELEKRIRLRTADGQESTVDEHQPGVSGRRIVALVRRAVAELVTEGRIFLKDGDRDIYEAIQPACSMARQLLEIMRAEGSREYSQDYLAAKLHASNPGMGKLQPRAVARCLGLLVEHSDIVQVADAFVLIG